MRLLILGGTKFVGRHLVDAAIARGHEPTLFHRGKTNADLFPGVERILGDRDGGLDALGTDRTWDAVVDTCGYVPRLVAASADRLAERVAHYTFISTISVYRDFPVAGYDEAYPRGTIDDPTIETVEGDTYGPLKALCEDAVETRYPGRSLYVRAGLIVGPYDPTDRFTYWPARAARGGRSVAPGDPKRPVQFVDGRDLADWVIRATEEKRHGAYNVTGPAAPLAFGDLVATCASVARTDLEPVWVSDAFLRAQGVEEFTGLPFWMPPDTPGYGGLMHARNGKAIAAGLRFRPLAETVRDTLAWHRRREGLPADGSLAAGPSPAREAALLAAWDVR